MTAERAMITGPADLRDQQWLDDRIAAIDDGMEAVIDIARNWSAGRNLARLHPGVAPAAYIQTHVGALGRDVIEPLLAESNWSNRQIATVAGVSPDTVDRTARNQAVERPAETLGADGKLRALPPPKVTHNSGDTEWYTPEPYIVAARAVMGGIDLDPASCELANSVVQAAHYIDAENDGLTYIWSGRVWLNPPYAHPAIEQFADKLLAELSTEVCIVDAAIMLVNNATETGWFQKLAVRAEAVCFLAGRVRFWHATRDSSSPLQGQAIFYFGPDVESFVATFSELGIILTSRRAA